MPDVPLQIHTPEDITARLARRIRAERLRLEWRQSTLASRSGVSVPTVRRFERTGRTSLHNLLKLCHALGRLDEFASLLQEPTASSMAELEHLSRPGKKRKRGVI